MRTRTMRALFALALSAAVALGISACGGSDSAAPASPDGTTSVEGADGASVRYGGRAASGATVRVARDGTGAPPLPAGTTPAGGIYQFGPVGTMMEFIEIRVPFDRALIGGGQEPRLLVAQPGKAWMDVVGARQEGDFMVARVVQLSYATVVGKAPLTGTRGNLMRRLSGDWSTYTAVKVEVDEAATTPALAPPYAESGVRPVTQPTQLALSVQYDLPACSGTAVVELVAVSLQTRADGSHKVTLAHVLSTQVSAQQGTLPYNQSLTASDNGIWVYIATATCKRDGGVEYFLFGVYGTYLEVDIAGATAPVITAAPQDANVVEGATATFSVAAQGTDLTYGWQRSNDGGATWATVDGASAASLDVIAALADNGAMFRAVVTSGTQSATSTPARLNVTQRVIAPAVTTDPSNQSVVEGETASFTVVGTGQPAPTIQWQSRAGANADPEAGWTAIAGATASTYTTAPTGLAQSGMQFRAVLSNAGGTAVSLPATLTVNAQVVAPGIVTGPQSLSVEAGAYGAFSVTASGTAPLSYQWFKNGQAIVGATAAEVLVLADPADVGGSYQITVHVSNAAGSVTSNAAAMQITPSSTTSALIKAGENGVVATPGEVEVVVPAGALAVDTTVAITTKSNSGLGLSSDVVPLGDVIEITPSSLVFTQPASFNLPMPDTLPEGKVFALLELPSDSTSQISVSGPNVRRVALGRVAGGKRTIAAVSGAAQVLCATAQNFRGGKFAVDLWRAARYVTAAVDESACDGNAKTSRPLIPSNTTVPCRSSDFVDDGNVRESLLSRHVHCQKGSTNIDLVGIKGDYGRYMLSWRIGSHGQAKGLNKTYRVALTLTRLVAGPAGSPTMTIRPFFDCTSQQYQGSCVSQLTQMTLSPGGEISRDVLVTFSYEGESNSWNEFSFYQLRLVYALPGEDIDKSQRTISASVVPTIRCDKQMAVSGGVGCVYADAPAVLVLSESDARVAEAAQHIKEAQQDTTLRSPGGLVFDANKMGYAAEANALQRTSIAAAKESNRLKSCEKKRTDAQTFPDSLRYTRPATLSPSCPKDETPCQCDEYPFAATWNGAAFAPSSTSVKIINGKHNEQAGTRLGQFYQDERVLDFSVYTGPSNPPYDPSKETKRAGELFWVHIE